MEVEIIFHSASTPLVRKDVEAIYTKGGFCCFQLKNGLIMKYPLMNIFSVVHFHGDHMGSIQKVKEDKKYR